MAFQKALHFIGVLIDQINICPSVKVGLPYETSCKSEVIREKKLTETDDPPPPFLPRS
jgi:hypothetical protein